MRLTGSQRLKLIGNFGSYLIVNVEIKVKIYRQLIFIDRYLYI